MKPTTFFGKLPILEVGGKPISQSAAISRYLANKFGYAGKTDEDKALADAFADQFKDFIQIIRPYFSAIRTGKPQEDIDAAMKDIVLPAYEEFFNLITEHLKKSSSGFLLDCGLTYPDLTLAELTGWAQQWNAIDPKFTEVLEHQKKVHSIPQIKKWIEKRPVSEY
ncbi:unnamed protein product [Caenorhabditis auriculariae]|uniref:glutathione transferase n=1 Tax=Caenorhabditis auriculariae TaxID=2777116 RepID=A0A8S1HGU1_9PELO|nr:unnamed protein product [Caenorhabditis auriculariae]